MAKWYHDSVFGCQTGALFGKNAPFPVLQTDSSCRRQDRWNADEVIGGGGQDKEPFDQAAPAMPRLAQTTNGLDPTERFLDPLSFDQADAIAGVPCRPCIDRRPATSIVLGDMRSAASLAAPGNELGRVIVLVSADGAARLGIIFNHLKGGGALGGAIGLRQPGVDDQAVAVLGHQMAHMAELGLLAGSLAKQTRVRVGRRGMRVVPAFLAVKVAFGIASAATCAVSRRGRAAAILGNEALHARPSLDQRPVYREMLTREQLANLRQIQHASHELTGNVAVQQSIPVLAEDGGIPDLIVHREADEPAEQQIIVELL